VVIHDSSWTDNNLWYILPEHRMLTIGIQENYMNIREAIRLEVARQVELLGNQDQLELELSRKSDGIMMMLTSVLREQGLRYNQQELDQLRNISYAMVKRNWPVNNQTPTWMKNTGL